MKFMYNTLQESHWTHCYWWTERDRGSVCMGKC